MRPIVKLRLPKVQNLMFNIRQDANVGDEINITATKDEIISLIQNKRLTPKAYLVKDDVYTELCNVDWCAPYFSGATEASSDVPFVAGADTAIPNTSAYTAIEEPGAYEDAVTCPHCWKRFKVEQVKYIASHPDLIGDPVVGENAQIRFIPTKFNEQGYAVDSKGMVCFDMACPHCHLRIPEVLTKLPALTFSIVGAPSCGKSYFLASMVWELRRQLSTLFDCSFADADPTFNAVLNNYESILFLNSNDEYVALPKTELRGDTTSNQIKVNDIVQDLPLPFIFTLTPLPVNPMYQEDNAGMKNVILYDNAGEHFQPGMDSVSNPATKHLCLSQGIMFLYDPFKDARMVKQCDANDPQAHQHGANQLVLLNEMINRIRKYCGICSTQKDDRPLVVVVPKFDAWKANFPITLSPEDCFYFDKKSMRNFLDLAPIKCVSFCLREMMLQYSPEVVSICESFFSTVYYVPVSALGTVPEYLQEKQMIAVKPQNITPLWITVPFLIQLFHAGLVEGVISDIAEAEDVTDYVFTHDTIVYTIPGINGRETVPLLYCGAKVYHQKVQKFIRFPMYPETELEQSGTNTAQDDKEFWNK